MSESFCFPVPLYDPSVSNKMTATCKNTTYWLDVQPNSRESLYPFHIHFRLVSEVVVRNLDLCHMQRNKDCSLLFYHTYQNLPELGATSLRREESFCARTNVIATKITNTGPILNVHQANMSSYLSGNMANKDEQSYLTDRPRSESGPFEN